MNEGKVIPKYSCVQSMYTVLSHFHLNITNSSCLRNFYTITLDIVI